MVYGGFIAPSTLPGERFSFIELTDEKGGERLRPHAFAKGDIAHRAIAGTCIPILWRMSWSRAPMSSCAQAGKAPGGSPGTASRSISWPLSKALKAQAFSTRPIWIGRKKAAPLALRLVAFRKPPEAAEASRAKARRAAQREGNVILGGTLAAAGMGYPCHLARCKRLLYQCDRRTLPRPLAHRDGVQTLEKPHRSFGAAGRRPGSGQDLDLGSSIDDPFARATRKRA